MDGLGGGDSILGGRGGDFLVGAAGGDLLLGGAGDDRIADPGPGAIDRIRCGDGSDFVEAGPDDVVGADCERVERPEVF